MIPIGFAKYLYGYTVNVDIDRVPGFYGAIFLDAVHFLVVFMYVCNVWKYIKYAKRQFRIHMNPMNILRS